MRGSASRDPNWPVGLLASAYWPSHDPQRLTMAICVGYFEGNDSRESTRTFTVSGYVSPKARWRFFEERWPRALRAEDLASFDGKDFIESTGQFASGWPNNDARRTRLITTLSRLTEQHVLRGLSCSIRLDDYDAVNSAYRFAEGASGLYGVCAAGVVSRLQQWMADHHPDDLTLFVFEEGDIDHRQVRRILKAEGIDKGEPVQVWPRQWRDEHGRRRFLRPFEACDLLNPECNSELPDRLSERSAWEHDEIDRDRLLRICETLGIERRSTSSSREMAR